MERYTKHNTDLGYYITEEYWTAEMWRDNVNSEWVDVIQGDCVDALAAYEDLNLTPEELTEKLARLDELERQIADGTYEKVVRCKDCSHKDSCQKEVVESWRYQYSRDVEWCSCGKEKAEESK